MVFNFVNTKLARISLMSKFCGELVANSKLDKLLYSFLVESYG